VAGARDAAVAISGLIAGKRVVSINKRDTDVMLAGCERLPDGPACGLLLPGSASYTDDMSVRRLQTRGERTWIGCTRSPPVRGQPWKSPARGA
jgi:hypothetical protein